MTTDEAIDALLELAKSRIVTIDGEWGCCHSFEEALTNSSEDETDYGGDPAGPINCTMHDEAVQVAELALILGRGI